MEKIKVYSEMKNFPIQNFIESGIIYSINALMLDKGLKLFENDNILKNCLFCLINISTTNNEQIIKYLDEE